MKVIHQNLISLKKNDDKIESKGFLIYPHTLDELRTFILDREKYSVLVTEASNQVIGFAICCELYMMPNLQSHLASLTHMGDVAQSKTLYLKQIAKAEGTVGVGSVLMQSILKLAYKGNYRSIISQIAHLPVRNKRSITFHGKFGFNHVSTIEEKHGVTGVYCLQLHGRIYLRPGCHT